MGNDHGAAHRFRAEPYIVVADTDDDAGGSLCGDLAPDRVPSPAFSAVWSMRIPDSITPPPRSSQWSVFVPEQNLALAGYGIDWNDCVLNDIWALDLASRRWRCVQAGSAAVSPRNGTTAVRLGDRIFLFGGFSGRAYLADFHVIALPTLAVARPRVAGAPPPGRVGHVMGACGHQIAVWGGYNGAWLSDLWVLDTDAMAWREVATAVKGRISAASAVHGDHLYIFGAAKADALLRYHWPTERLEPVRAGGAAPPAELSQASLVAAGDFLLLVGGRLDRARHCGLYGYDVRRQRWFVFPVRPDGETTALADGVVDRDGTFQLPRTWSASAVFRAATREVVLFLGQPFLEPPHLGVVGVGPALAVLHLQGDLLDALHS
jgi:hypothetical protein